MSYLLAIDQGTSSTRAALYSEEGILLHMSQYQLTQYYPHPGWVEQDPEEIWQKTLKAIRDVTAAVIGNEILACGITNQRETTVIWDKETGECLSRAIVWQDRRTQEFCLSLAEYAELLNRKTGLFPDPYFSATKLHWLLAHIPKARQLAKRNQLAFGTMDSFILWRLSGGKSHATDITNASRTLLFNITEQRWDEELLQLFAIPLSILPDVYACDAHFGIMDPKWLGAAIPITGMAGDQQAALIGQRCFEKGMIKATFGTGGFLLLNTGEAPVTSNHKLLTTIAYRIQGQTIYGLEGSLYQAGTTVKWLRDELKLFKHASDTEALAASLAGNDGVYLVPSFTGLGAPHWLNTNGALIVGLSRTSGSAHFARAALESVCYQTREVLACMRHDSSLGLLTLHVDGGMAANNWFLQFLASQCGLTVQRPHDIETTALGAAILAGIGCGVFNSLQALQQNWCGGKELRPENNKEKIESDYQGWQRALRMLKAG
ncbi:glycerol kinase GlpK [Legionella septentrionalis]|uniref:glycerol kinase GlpK n=1 Tax=Legionella septentrionalis TaxID=2498109 RepID=UPI000F8CBE26|nr:glycerol kinase GlpK [Legionella septentrionalis]RUQ95106.1 glycerol kinase [Legionella septentrionalis]RUR13156.1 glycerol kinase [Legionella septentrionalis]